MPNANKAKRAAAAAVEPTSAAPEGPRPIPLSPDPGSGRELDGFGYLAALSPGEWDERIVYLYRQDPRISKSDERNKKYIDKLSAPFDEDYVKQRFGGGKFLAIIKNQRDKAGAERMFSFEIEGAPQLQPDEKFRDQTAAVNPAPIDQSALIRDLTREVVSVARENRERSEPEEDAVARVAETMQRGAEAAMDMMKHAAQSVTGSPMADKIMEAALTRLNGGAPADPLANLAGAVALFKQLGLGAGAAQNPLGVLRELKDGLGIDIAAALRGGKEDWRATLAGMVPSLFEGAIGILDRYSQLQRQNFEISLATHRERTAFRQAATAAAAPAGAAAGAPGIAAAPPPSSVLPASFGAAAPGAGPDPAPAPRPELDFDKVRRLIVRHFQNGKAGDFVADLLMELYPDHLVAFRALLADANQLAALAKEDAILSEIAGDQDFPEFLAELVHEFSPEPTPTAAS